MHKKAKRRAAVQLATTHLLNLSSYDRRCMDILGQVERMRKAEWRERRRELVNLGERHRCRSAERLHQKNEDASSLSLQII